MAPHPHCSGLGHIASPLELPLVVEAASLGLQLLTIAEELAFRVSPNTCVVWRVADALALRGHFIVARDNCRPATSPEDVAAVAWYFPDDLGEAVAELAEAGLGREAQAVADLSARGLYLLSHDRERVVIAVPSLADFPQVAT
jgi:hypothetical protein